MSELRIPNALLLLNMMFQWAFSIGCPPVSGNLTIEYLDLYPESADWDSINCVLYLRFEAAPTSDGITQAN